MDIISPPDILKRPLIVPHKILMGAGPANISPRVIHSMTNSILGHMNSEIFQIMDEIKAGIKYIFQTKNELSLAISASGHSGMEAILSNLLEPGDVVLIATNGIWGFRAADMAKRYDTKPIQMMADYGDNFSLNQIENNLKKYSPKLLFIVQGETSTGVYQPIEGIGDLCHKYNCLLAVDTVASVAGVPFLMDKWGVDAAYAGVQKAIGAPPGLTIISFSPNAQKVIFERKTPSKVYFWDMKILGQQWNCYNNVRPYHHTTCSTLLCSLRESLAIITEEGLENWHKKHDECYRRLRDGIEKLGLHFFVKDENKRLKTVTSVEVTDFDWKELITYAMNKYNVEIAGGLGPTAGKILRIGVMGYNANPNTVDYVLKVLKESLEHARRRSSKL
ncbi:alanine--glyoxylate aminotransferase [Diorhabda sublineata]|uniref:alanine--glyoxylate aminotransferase n=1 Tax=Diorhabda sublineata TaxID=1163346 RepID=UPI0024E0F0DD|nr:alanine--glyoxylate aminotransferase [Diorhabda sublineata]XP_056632634.1 alanine--glyoxylate aminotransferase [Diorhabda sublineata]